MSRLLLNALVGPVYWTIHGVIIIYAVVSSMTLWAFFRRLSVSGLGFVTLIANIALPGSLE